ncbi:hypothetical protein CASFOL_034283 [Castilleja foliolosa]|uniref:Ubiquitin-like protease family profile domain-containing protein n=1 Tax=Castilleja foliolosa TaxID=1961234 RepID=A0ABD3BXU2_9LAMI
MYIYALLGLSERNHKYGLISPLHGNSEEMLQTRIGEGDFECFLAPIYDNCCGQGDDYQCGLQVMRHMFAIIKLDIVDSFDKVFNIDQPYSETDIDVVRRHWTECSLEVLSRA